MALPHENLNSQLMSEGTVVIPQKDLPFTKDDWKTLSATLDNLAYEDIYEGDTDEATSVKVFRVKKEKDETIYHSPLMQMINSPSMKQYISRILDIDDYILERCQCHIYREGNFVSKHQDNASCREFQYAFMLLLDGQYEGGEFCVYGADGSALHTYRPSENSLIVTKCSLPHEVKKITKGERKVIVGFLKFPHLSIH